MFKSILCWNINMGLRSFVPLPSHSLTSEYVHVCSYNLINTNTLLREFNLRKGRRRKILHSNKMQHLARRRRSCNILQTSPVQLSCAITTNFLTRDIRSVISRAYNSSIVNLHFHLPSNAIERANCQYFFIPHKLVVLKHQSPKCAKNTRTNFYHFDFFKP